MAQTSGPGSTYNSETVDLNDYTVREPVEQAFYMEYGRAHIFGDGDVDGLSSDDGNSIIHVKNDLVKDGATGHTVGFGLLRKKGGFGVRGDTELENKEGTIEYADCRIAIDQHRDGLRSGSRITRQGLTWRFMKTALRLLAEQVRTIDEFWFCMQAANYDANATLSTYYDDAGNVIDPTDTITTGLNTTLAADGDHIVLCSADNTTEQSLDSDDYLDRKYLLEVMAINDQLPNPMRPVTIGGEDCNLLVCNTNVTRRMKESDTEMYALIKANLQGSQAKEAWPYFTKRLMGKFEDILIMSSPHIPPAVTGSTNGAPLANRFRNVLLGAQAIAKAYGMATPNDSRLGLVYGDRDHKDKEYVSFYRLVGMQCTQFKDRSGTARNHGSFILPSFATRPAISSPAA